MPVAGQVWKRKTKKAELRLNIKCAVHPWMSAYVHILDNPFFALTQFDGSFEIRGLPPGAHTVRVMHEIQLESGRGFQPDVNARVVTVKPNETVSANFTYRIVKKAPPPGD